MKMCLILWEKLKWLFGQPNILQLKTNIRVLIFLSLLPLESLMHSTLEMIVLIYIILCKFFLNVGILPEYK